MSSSEHGSRPLDAVEQFLVEHGVDPSHAPSLRALLGPPEHGRRANKSDAVTIMEAPVVGAPPPVTGVGPTLAVVSASGDGAASTDASGEFEFLSASAVSPPEMRLVVGAVLGVGGMGEVLRVGEPALHRTLAMKVLLPEFSEQPVLRERFVAEAQVTAQLAHPGIPPVHEMGMLPDGRPYFTMKEVRGVTLAQLLADMETDPAAAARWTEPRRLDVFQKVCVAVAYAHSRGVTHCDLKPENVMVGAFGEVLVMDWGVARVSGTTATQSGTGEPPVRIEEQAARRNLVAGTPAYMAPEQAAGRFELLGPPADVFALGVMLYEVLSGSLPYGGTTAELRARAEAGIVPPLPAREGSSADDALLAIITRAMAPDPGARFPDAKAMDDELARWREGAARRERALSLVERARTMEPEIEPAFALASELRERALRELAALGSAAPITSREALWALEDEAAELSRSASLRLVEAEQLLLHALAQAPGLPEARERLAALRFGRHRDAERRRDWDEAARHELVLREHDTGAHREYLRGTSPLSIDTDPRCLVRLHRVVQRSRRLVTQFVRELGYTPLLDVELPVGSYVLELVARDRPSLFYPVSLRRLSGWGGARPGESTPYPVRIPAAGEVLPGEVYVPDGCTEVGDDHLAPGSLPGDRLWVDGFVIRQHPCTFSEVTPFLSEPSSAHFLRAVYRDGARIWRPDWPVVGLAWDAATAMAAWLSGRTGRTWRLPAEVEWEKAARGVDGRIFPWGDFADAAFCHSRTADRTPSGPTSVHAFDLDRSVYGVRGCGGNVRDWCADTLAPRPDPAARVARGGSWRQPPEAARVAARIFHHTDIGYPDVGVRLVRSL